MKHRKPSVYLLFAAFRDYSQAIAKVFLDRGAEEPYIKHARPVRVVSSQTNCDNFLVGAYHDLSLDLPLHWPKLLVFSGLKSIYF